MPRLLKWLWVILLMLLIPFLSGQAEPRGSNPEATGVAPPNPEPAVTRPNAALQGNYTLDRTASDDIDRAIDATVSRMSFITRGIARARLKKDNPAFQRASITRDGGAVTISLDGTPIRMVPDGQSRPWTRADGATFGVSLREAGTKLVQTFDAKDGRRVNTYSLSLDGQTLTLNVLITSPRLPGPLRYSLVFQRVA